MLRDIFLVKCNKICLFFVVLLTLDKTIIPEMLVFPDKSYPKCSLYGLLIKILTQPSRT